VQSFGSATFFMTAVLFSSNASVEFGRTSLEAAIALRDHSQKLYHVLSWYTMWNLTELPFQLLFTTVLLVPAYFLIGFPADATVFFEFYLFACLIASTGVALGYCASCVMPRKSLVVAMGMGIILLSTVFGGPFMNRKTTPVYFLWIQQISPVKYAYHGMLRAFWSHIDSIPCPAGTVCRVTTGQAVLAMNIVRPDKFSSDWHILLVLNLSLRVLGGLGLWFRASRKYV
jgi:ABC-type multidrug transport system permease subunit